MSGREAAKASSYRVGKRSSRGLKQQGCREAVKVLYMFVAKEVRVRKIRSWAFHVGTGSGRESTRTLNELKGLEREAAEA